MKLAPETKGEQEMAGTPDGRRILLHRYSHYDTLTRSVMNCAEHLGLSGEDTMVLLAFEALRDRERLLDAALNHYMLLPPLPLTV